MPGSKATLLPREHLCAPSYPVIFQAVPCDARHMVSERIVAVVTETANKSGNTYGAHSQFDFYPEERYALVVLSNLETWAPEAIVYKARELITRR